MEQNKGQKKKRGIIDTSVVLSFVVAIFAIFSLAMAGLSMNQKSGVSYAAPTANDNSFTLKYETETIGSVTYDKHYIAEDENHNLYMFPMYYANTIGGGNQVFCIERNRDVVNNSNYTKTDQVFDDPGLLYLLNLGYNNRDLKNIDAKFDYPDDIDGWVIQSAIWYYLATKYPEQDEYKLVDKTDGSSQELHDRIVMLTSGTVTIKKGRNDAGVVYSNTGSAIKTLYGLATNASAPRITATVDSNEYSKSDDGKYYVSALINVVGDPSSSLENFDIELSGIKDAKIIDQDGKEVATTNITPGTKLYVRVPADNVTEKGQTVKLDITGHFAGGTAYKYVSNDSPQKMALLGPANKKTGVEIVFAPDTGMNTTQTIYFIGLIVLLCGIGIVYANAKPVQVKQ